MPGRDLILEPALDEISSGREMVGRSRLGSYQIEMSSSPSSIRPYRLSRRRKPCLVVLLFMRLSWPLSLVRPIETRPQMATL